jgi:hypothetical protein
MGCHGLIPRDLAEKLSFKELQGKDNYTTSLNED